MVVEQVIDKVLEKEANKVDREVTAYVITDLFINQLANLVISFSEHFPMKRFSASPSTITRVPQTFFRNGQN